MDNGVIIAFLAGGIFVGVISFYLSRILLRAEVLELIKDQTQDIINRYELKITFLKQKLKLVEGQRDIAVQDARQALHERNEAMLMLSKKISDDESGRSRTHGN